MRIAKYIAAAGICSRRQAERYIDAGRVTVNDVVIDGPAMNIAKDDVVCVDGKKINLQTTVRLWLYHKPAGLVTSHKDELGRQNVFETLHGLPRVISVGRLDLNSEGLLLLTNSGALARELELPSNKFDRIYKVRAFGDSRAILKNTDNDQSLSCNIDGMRYKFTNITLNNNKTGYNKIASKAKSNNWYEVTLQEGKNREIRKVFEYYGLQVNRLIRTSYAGFVLGKIEVGKWQEVQIPQNLLDNANLG